MRAMRKPSGQERGWVLTEESTSQDGGAAILRLTINVAVHMGQRLPAIPLRSGKEPETKKGIVEE